MKTTTSYNVQIWCGLKIGYEVSGREHSMQEVFKLCQDYVNKEKECVTITPTSFVYTDGFENGVVVGFISYPRFAKNRLIIRKRAIDLAQILMDKLVQ
jgi:hypothetical protein